MKESERVIAALVDACYTALNLEGPAQHAVYFLPAFSGLDVPYHCAKIRAAIEIGNAYINGGLRDESN
jgi:glycerol kinase